MKYRIIRDTYAGYEVQVKRWYWPFWHQGRTNTHATLERARAYAHNLSKKPLEKGDI